MKLNCLRLVIVVAIAGWVVAGIDADDSSHRQQNFILHLNGSMSEVAPMFGPVREAEWAPDWNPKFVHPSIASQAEGAVFTTNTHGGPERIWIMTVYDEKEGRIEYVVVTPGVTANEIKIRISSQRNDRSQATVSYRKTALSAEGRTEVEKLDAAWSEQQRNHWETAINGVLARRPPK